jgi:hypothetical protein
MFDYQYRLERCGHGWIALNKFAGVPAWDTVFDTRDEAVIAACFEIAVGDDYTDM